MSDLLQLVLSDPEARSETTLPSAASDLANKFVPWGGE